MNWLTTLTAKAIFDQVCDKYINLPTSFSYWVLSIGTPSIFFPNFLIRVHRSIYRFAANHSCFFKVIENIFLCDTMIPFLERATSIPRMYPIGLRFFISSLITKCSFNLFICSKSSPLRIISSTWTIRIVTFSSLENLKNKVWFVWAWV